MRPGLLLAAVTAAAGIPGSLLFFSADVFSTSAPEAKPPRSHRLHKTRRNQNVTHANGSTQR